MAHLSKEKVDIAHNGRALPEPMALRLGYARCSTDEQADALAAQVARLEGAGCDRIISELESGRNNDRPGLLEAMALVARGQVAELLITRADRLGRDAAFADQLIAACALAGTTITALDGGQIEAATPQGFLAARLQTTMAEVESRMLSQRIRRQFETYRQQGRHLRRRKPFGFRAGADHRLEPHPEQWPQALRVIAELRRLRSFSAVAQQLPSWCEWTPASSNLQAWFCSPVIRGHIGHNWDRSSGKGWKQRWDQILHDQHPPLIGETEWQELADSIRRTRNSFAAGPTVDARHGLTGLLVCDSCGHRMRRNTAAGVAWWRCRHRLCQQRGGIKEGVALPVVIAACVEASDALAAAADAPVDDDPVLTMKRRDLEQLQGLAARNPALDGAVAALRQEVEGMARRVRSQPDPRIRQLLTMPGFFEGAAAEEQRAIFGAVLSEVLVGPGGQPLRALPRMM